MALSMTGCGEGAATDGANSCRIELRTVNNRFFKLSLRTREGLNAIEGQIEAAIRKRVRRGTVQMALDIAGPLAPGLRRLDLRQLEAYLDDLETLCAKRDIPEPRSIDGLLGLPGVCLDAAAAAEITAQIWPLVERALEDALAKLDAMRRAEGEALAADMRATPPHDLMDKPVADAFPRGTGSRLLTDIMSHSATWLADHPVNQRRVGAGKRPATHVWLWGVGRAPAMEPFAEKYGMSGTMITAVDLLRGLAALAGWKRCEVPGATGYLDTDYSAKGRYAIAELEQTDLVCVHIEAPDEASHEGDAAAKVKALEEIDEKIVGPLAAHLQTHGDYRMLVCPDHPTFIATKTHSRGGVPFVMAGSGIAATGQKTYDEIAAAASAAPIEPGWTLMGEFLRKG